MCAGEQVCRSSIVFGTGEISSRNDPSVLVVKNVLPRLAACSMPLSLQVEHAFSSHRLCNWEVPKREKKVSADSPFGTLTAKSGMTGFIVDDRGHLLSGQGRPQGTQGATRGWVTSFPHACMSPCTSMLVSMHRLASISLGAGTCEHVLVHRHPVHVCAGKEARGWRVGRPAMASRTGGFMHVFLRLVSQAVPQHIEAASLTP